MMNEWILSSTILIAAVLAVRFLLRGRISLRLQYALWAVVLVRLLVPVQLFTSEFGAGAIAQSVDMAEPVRQVYATVRDESYQQDYDDAYRQVVAEYETSSQSYDPTAAEITAQDMVRRRMELDLSQILWGVWLAGVVVMTSVIVSCNVHLSLHLRRSRREFAVASSLLPVYVTEAVPTPCIFGLLCPTVYLTPDAAGDEQVRNHVLTHELTHYRHLDHIWSVLRGVCLVLHWYNPLVWVAAQVSRADAELACDEGAMMKIGESHRGDYGRTLIDLTCAKRVDSMFIAATTMTGSAGSIRKRIKLLMKRPRNTVVTLTAMLLMVTLIVGCTFSGAPETTEPVAQQTQPTETQPPETAPAETTVPETTIPETTVPETTVPETTMPEATVPMETVVIPEAPEKITAESWQKNHLNAWDYEVYGIQDGAKAAERPVLGSRYKRSQIKTVTFLDTLENAPATAWYVGIDGREDRVLAWVEPNGALYDLYIGAWGGINGRDYSAYLFAGYENLEEVRFGGAFHTEWCGEFVRMFLGCRSLKTVDVENLNSYNVHTFESMFEGCTSLTGLDAGALDNTHLIITSRMFANCESLTELDLSGWDADALFRTDEMFQNCRSLKKLDLSGMGTSEVVNMIGMFENCDSLKTLDLSSWDVGKLAYASDMFSGCYELESLNLNGFRPGDLMYMSGMFHSCESLKSLDLSGWDISQVQDLWGVFAFCRSLETLDLSGWDTGNVTSMNSMFANCSALKDLDLTHFDTSHVTDFKYMFSETRGVTVDDVRHFDTSSWQERHFFMEGDDWQFLFK